MTQMLRVALALGAVFFALALAACGDSVPSGDVAKVDSATISKDSFNHWLLLTARQAASQTGSTAKVVLPDPPTFAKCIAAAKAAAPALQKGQTKPTDVQYKATCKQQYEQQKSQVVSFLLRSEWLAQEAKRQNVSVSDKEVQASFDAARKQAFPKTADFAKFLKTSGQTQADLLYRQREQVLEKKITDKITKDSSNVSDKEITAYYEKNKKQFTTPEMRAVHVVLTRDQATTAKARAQIAGGANWASVATKVSIDPASKANGGSLASVAKGQSSPQFDKAVFALKVGEISQPFKTADGWYIARVDKIKAQVVQPLSAVTKGQIKQVLGQQGQSKVLSDFSKSYTKRWKSKSTCQKGYVVPDCKNSKPVKAVSTAAPGAVPQTQTAPAPTTTTPPTTTGG